MQPHALCRRQSASMPLLDKLAISVAFGYLVDHETPLHKEGGHVALVSADQTTAGARAHLGQSAVWCASMQPKMHSRGQGCVT